MQNPLPNGCGNGIRSLSHQDIKSMLFVLYLLKFCTGFLRVQFYPTEGVWVLILVKYTGQHTFYGEDTLKSTLQFTNS